MQAQLTIIEGPNVGLVYTFDQHSTFLVGRSPSAHFCLPESDLRFSRIHFLIELNPPQCRVVDMNSRNGTYVNGVRVASADLQDGDQIGAGHTTLQLALRASTDNEPETALSADPLDEQTAPLEATLELPALTIPGYEIVRELGRGGMGVVYLAHRLADRFQVALKTIVPAAKGNSQVVAKFLREAKILESLDHPHIVKLRELGYDSGRFYFAMEYVEGVDASRLLKQHGPLSVRRAVDWICQLLEALEYAHAKGFVHRDIKPANMLMTQKGGQEVVKLVDFGLARTYQASPLSGLTLTGQVGGTLPFMAPEQITDFRDAGPLVDQYAAVATLYNLLTGRFLYDFPLAMPSHERLMLVLLEEPVPIRSRREDVPEPLAALIHRGLNKEAGQRFANVTALREALAAMK